MRKALIIYSHIVAYTALALAIFFWAILFIWIGVGVYVGVWLSIGVGFATSSFVYRGLTHFTFHKWFRRKKIAS